MINLFTKPHKSYAPTVLVRRNKGTYRYVPMRTQILNEIRRKNIPLDQFCEAAMITKKQFTYWRNGNSSLSEDTLERMRIALQI